MDGRGQIQLGSKRFRVDIASYKERDLADFAPRAATPGGSVIHSELLLYQPLLQTDWQHGFGFIWYEDAQGYASTVGNIDTRHDSIAMLYTKSTSSDTDNNQKRGVFTFKGDVYTWGEAGLRRFNGTTWTTVYPGDLNFAMALGDRIVVFPDGGRPKYSMDGDADSTPYQKATLTTAEGTNANLTFTANVAGTDGNDITMTYQTGAGAAGQEVVGVSGTDITVTLHADSTALQVMNAILNDVPANASNATRHSDPNARLVFTAVDAGEAGNGIRVILSSGSVTTVGSENVSVSGKTITVNVVGLMTRSAYVKTLIEQSTAASALITVAFDPGGNGTGIAVNGTNTTHTVTLVGGSVDSARNLIAVSLASGEDGTGKPGAMAKTNLAGGTGKESWITTGINSKATDFLWAIIHNGKVYAGVDGTTRVHYSTDEDIHSLEGSEDDPGKIVVGAGSVPTISAISAFGNLYIARWDGLWLLGEDNIARRVLDYYSDSSQYNFKSMAVFNGYLHYAIRDQIFQWTGARVSNITPQKLNETFPYKTYGEFANLVVGGSFLYCTARTNESTPVEDLLVWDGVGWHKLMTLTTTGRCTMLGFDPNSRTLESSTFNNRLWYHIDNGTSNATYYIPLQDRSMLPYASFPTTGDHQLIFSRWDMGYRWVQKSSPSIVVEASNLSAGHYYLKLHYRCNGSTTWLPWGGTDGTTNVISTSGRTELTYPEGHPNGDTVEYYDIQFRVTFITDDDKQSPILEGITLRFLMRPDVFYGYSFNIVAALDTEDDMMQDNRTALEIINDIKEVRDSKEPVTFIDPYNGSHKVYITSMVVNGLEEHELEQDVPNVEAYVIVNLAEVS